MSTEKVRKSMTFDRKLFFSIGSLFIVFIAIILLCEYVVSSFSLGDLAIGSNFDNADDYH